MEVGIRNAKNNLSRLVEAVLDGKEVFLTNRGERGDDLATRRNQSTHTGAGALEGKANLYSGWDSPEADKDIERMFESHK